MLGNVRWFLLDACLMLLWLLHFLRIAALLSDTLFTIRQLLTTLHSRALAQKTTQSSIIAR